MTNDEKYKMIKSITVQDVIDSLDGYVVGYELTQKNMDVIDGRYVFDKQFHYTIFDKNRYKSIHLSNGRWLDNNQSFLEEYSKRKNKYWDEISKNIMRKCKSVDDFIHIVIKNYAKYLHFKIRDYDYINIRKFVSRNKDVYQKDVSEELKYVKNKKLEMLEMIERLNRTINKLETHDYIHKDLYDN